VPSQLKKEKMSARCVRFRRMPKLDFGTRTDKLRLPARRTCRLNLRPAACARGYGEPWRSPLLE